MVWLTNCCNKPSEPPVQPAISKELAGKRVDCLERTKVAIGVISLTLFVATLVLAGVATAGKVTPNVVFYTFIGCTTTFFITKIIDNSTNFYANKHGINRMEHGFQKRNSPPDKK